MHTQSFMYLFNNKTFYAYQVEEEFKCRIKTSWMIICLKLDIIIRMHTYTHICEHMHRHTYVSTYVSMYVCMHLCMEIHMYYILAKPGARQLQASVRLVSRNHFRAAKVCVCVCVCVCVHPLGHK